MVNPRPQYVPPQKVERAPGKPKQTINRRKRERMDRDAEYLALLDCYLEENQSCVVCGKAAVEIHHICSGTAGRPISLRNQNTWLENCGTPCREKLDAMPFDEQVELKVKSVKETIARLRT